MHEVSSLSGAPVQADAVRYNSSAMKSTLMLSFVIVTFES